VVVTTFGRLWLDSQPVELHHTRHRRLGGDGEALYRMNQPLSMRDDGGRPRTIMILPMTIILTSSKCVVVNLQNPVSRISDTYWYTVVLHRQERLSMRQIPIAEHVSTVQFRKICTESGAILCARDWVANSLSGG
jgi:hypothetical protein